MLRMEVLAYPDKSLEVNGAILTGGGGKGPGIGPNGVGPGGGDLDEMLPKEMGLGVLEPSRTYESQNTQPPGLRFRALLSEGGGQAVQLHNY